MPGSEEWSILEQQFEVGLLDETGLSGASPNASAFHPLSYCLQAQQEVLNWLCSWLHPLSPPRTTELQK